MPCLSSSAVSVLNESIRVSNAESQLAVPLTITTLRGVRAISSPNGSAVCTGATAGGGAAGVAGVAGAGAAGAGAAGVGGDAGACACAPATPSEIAAAGISAARPRLKPKFNKRQQFIQAVSPWPSRPPAMAPAAYPGSHAPQRYARL